MCEMLVSVVEEITGAGEAARRRSADPERDVEALLPCLAIMRRGEAIIEDVVETL